MQHTGLANKFANSRFSQQSCLPGGTAGETGDPGVEGLGSRTRSESTVTFLLLSGDCGKKFLFRKGLLPQFRLVPNRRIGTLCLPWPATAANVAQLAEQLICNQPVVGSNPSVGS